MEESLVAMAEGLVEEYHDLPAGVVVRVLSRCLQQFPSAGSYFIRQAARARLSALRQETS